MKLKKTLFSTEIEFTPNELSELRYRISTSMFMGLVVWFRKVYGLDLLPAVQVPAEDMPKEEK